MTNWLKNIIKSALKELSQDPSFDSIFKKSTEHIVLNPDYPNILTVDIGQIPMSKERELLEKMTQILSKKYPTYKIHLIGKRG